MYRFLLFLLSIILFLQPQSSLAENSAAQVAVVNVQSVLNDSQTAKAARSRLEAEVGQRQSHLDKLSVEVQKLEEEFRRQSALLAADALEDKHRQLQSKKRDLGRTYQDEQEALARRRAAALEGLVEKLNSVVNEIAAREGYRIVMDLDGRIVLFASARIDITEEVIRALDSR